MTIYYQETNINLINEVQFWNFLQHHLPLFSYINSTSYLFDMFPLKKKNLIYYNQNIHIFQIHCFLRLIICVVPIFRPVSTFNFQTVGSTIYYIYIFEKLIMLIYSILILIYRIKRGREEGQSIKSFSTNSIFFSTLLNFHKNRSVIKKLKGNCYDL